MGVVHKISADFYEELYAIIAIHSGLEDYALVYEINRCLKTNFRRSSKDLDLSELGVFTYFEWKDEINERYWTLISNDSHQQVHLTDTDLFSNEPSYGVYRLIPEHKEVDYFLKMESEEGEDLNEIVKSLFGIPKIQMAYELDTQKLKSKNNLIF